MKNNKLLIIILSVLLVSLSGCIDKKKYYVECDSGFKTSLSSHAYSEDGVISWRADELEGGNFYHTRKMLSGEACLTKVVIEKAN